MRSAKCYEKAWPAHKAVHEALDAEQKRSRASIAEQDCDSPVSAPRRPFDHLAEGLVQHMKAFGGLSDLPRRSGAGMV